MAWTQRKLFDALSERNKEWVKRGDGLGHNKPGNANMALSAAKDCAVLYSPDVETNRPLHLNPGRPEWDRNLQGNPAGY